MDTANEVIAALAAAADADDARQLQRFFKTGPGEYGEGDVFVGVRVPAIRALVKRFAGLPLDEVDTLLDSPVHEHRLAALLILVEQFRRDLVDLSALYILGEWLYDRPRDLVFELGADDDLWRRRVALLTTFGFIRRGDASTTLELAARVLHDRRDLTQKATGWMLREVGKRVDRTLLLDFLDRHADRMGATALSYATEHLDAETRAHFRLLRSR